MSTTVDDIRTWLVEAKRQKATHMIVVCDTFDFTDFPVYVMLGEDVRKIAAEHRDGDMKKLMEVYSLSKDIETQLAETRAFNYD